MEKEEIRRATCIVIRRNGQYLSHREMCTGRLVWSPHLSSAWRTRDREAARNVSRMTGGRQMLFNPITWEVRVL